MKKMILSVAVLAIGFTSCNKKAEADATTNDTLTQVDTNQVIDDHTSQIAVDWPGVYVGALPCADCEGIQTEVTLNSDDTFAIKQTYLGKEGAPIEDSGKIMWHGGTIVHLKGKTVDMKLKVGENQLFVLDQDGKVIEGPMKDLYILKKN